MDGKIEERNLGESEHCRIQTLLAALLCSNERQWGITTVVEQLVRVTATRVRIPGVCALRQDAPGESVTATPPLLCIEVLSPEDRWSRVSRLVEDYLTVGVEHLWIITPARPGRLHLHLGRPT